MDTTSHPLQIRTGVALALLILTSTLNATTYTVLNTADSGVGSLRWAIEQANGNLGPDTIEFAIPDADSNYNSLLGVWVIQPTTELPWLADTSGGTTIDGATQTQLSADINPFGPEIRIESAIGVGLHLESDGNRIFGLNIDDCPSGKLWIQGANNWVAGCYIGTDPTGSSVVTENGSIGIIVRYGRARDNLIGTNGDGIDDDREGNVISGCYRGVEVAGEPGQQEDPDGYYSGRPRGTWIAGNLIGVDRTGTIALGNGIDANNESTGHGVMINGATETLVGTNGDGVSDSVERNIITASDDSDVMIRHQGWDETDRGGDGNVIAGNYIGTDITGTVALRRSDEPPCSGVTIMMGSKLNRIELNVISGHTPERDPGVVIIDDGTDENLILENHIGTDASGSLAVPNGWVALSIALGARNNRVEANLISGNVGAGISVNGNPIDPGILRSGGNQIHDNLVGTDVTGQNALPNEGIGVSIWDSADNRVQGNVISGNNLAGVEIVGPDAHHNRLVGNLIGTDITGTMPLGNGRVTNPWAVGLSQGAHDNFIGTDGDGTDDATEGNVLAGSGGVILFDETTTRNKIAGNFIGTDRTGNLPLPHENEPFPGVVISGAVGNYVGTDGDGMADELEGNTIAFNRGEGVVVRLGPSTGNSIRGNSIHANGALGIDLSLDENMLNGDGPTGNDPFDEDIGPNQLQNFPVITSASRTGTKTTIMGTLNSTVSANFTLDFYANPECDGSGYGEGEQYLGWATVNTDGDGYAAFTAALIVAAPPGWFITATATDADGNTSEFSACSPPLEAGAVPVSIDIKPGSDPNSINLGSSGTIPVAILSSADFDAATVDPTTVTLANAVVKLRGQGTAMAAMEDVNGDGRLDLVVHVVTSALELAADDVVAQLTGATFGGTPIEGSDSVRIVQE